MKANKNSVFLSLTIVKIILFCFTSLFASLTIFTHIAQITNLEFNGYLLFAPLVALITLVGIAIIAQKRNRNVVNLSEQK